MGLQGKDASGIQLAPGRTTGLTRGDVREDRRVRKAGSGHLG